MRTQVMSQFLFAGFLLFFQISRAESISGAFEILDLSGEINGEPQLASETARSSWQKACQEWKIETKELNQKNEIIALSCETPNCSLTNSSKTQCSSTGTYKIKTAGTRVNNAPIASTPAPTAYPEAPSSADAPAQQVIVETVPYPRFGFIWIPGFWGWQAHRPIWRSGYWSRERPGYFWARDHWNHRGPGWHNH